MDGVRRQACERVEEKVVEARGQRRGDEKKGLSLISHSKTLIRHRQQTERENRWAHRDYSFKSLSDAREMHEVGRLDMLKLNWLDLRWERNAMPFMHESCWAA